MNRHALGENPLTRRRDSILRNTERLETADESFTSATAVSAAAMTADDGTRAADNRVQFVLTPRHLQLLDDFCYQVRRATRYKLNRSEIVRVLIEQLANKELHFQHIRSEEDLQQRTREILHS